jgi:hypothetical protein
MLFCVGINFWYHFDTLEHLFHWFLVRTELVKLRISQSQFAESIGWLPTFFIAESIFLFLTTSLCGRYASCFRLKPLPIWWNNSSWRSINCMYEAWLDHTSLLIFHDISFENVLLSSLWDICRLLHHQVSPVCRGSIGDVTPIDGID